MVDMTGVPDLLHPMVAELEAGGRNSHFFSIAAARKRQREERSPLAPFYDDSGGKIVGPEKKKNARVLHQTKPKTEKIELGRKVRPTGLNIALRLLHGVVLLVCLPVQFSPCCASRMPRVGEICCQSARLAASSGRAGFAMVE